MLIPYFITSIFMYIGKLRMQIHIFFMCLNDFKLGIYCSLSSSNMRRQNVYNMMIYNQFYDS